jgi:hypothetical protein
VSGRLTILALAAIVVPCAAAGARGGDTIAPLQAALDKHELKRNTHGKATARCDGGDEIVSNGFAAPDRVYAGGGPYTDILGGIRKGNRAFVVKAENFSSTRGDFYAYAYCGDVGKVTVAEERKKVGSFDSAVVTARCPRGLTAISGGWTGQAIKGGRPQMSPFLSKRAGARGWKIGAENYEFKGEAILVVQAYCADVPAPEVRVNDQHVSDLSQPVAGISCRGGKEAVAGGFDAATKNGFAAGASVYTSRRKKGGARWKIELINGGQDRHLKVFAYCA